VCVCVWWVSLVKDACEIHIILYLLAALIMNDGDVHLSSAKEIIGKMKNFVNRLTLIKDSHRYSVDL
jgi:hypothetical protein